MCPLSASAWGRSRSRPARLATSARTQPAPGASHVQASGLLRGRRCCDRHAPRLATTRATPRPRSAFATASTRCRCDQMARSDRSRPPYLPPSGFKPDLAGRRRHDRQVTGRLVVITWPIPIQPSRPHRVLTPAPRPTSRPSPVAATRWVLAPRANCTLTAAISAPSPMRVAALLASLPEGQARVRHTPDTQTAYRRR